MFRNCGGKWKNARSDLATVTGRCQKKCLISLEDTDGRFNENSDCANAFFGEIHGFYKRARNLLNRVCMCRFLWFCGENEGFLGCRPKKKKKKHNGIFVIFIFFGQIVMFLLFFHELLYGKKI